MPTQFSRRRPSLAWQPSPCSRLSMRWGNGGYVPIHQAFVGYMSPGNAARRSSNYLKVLTG